MEMKLDEGLNPRQPSDLDSNRMDPDVKVAVRRANRV